MDVYILRHGESTFNVNHLDDTINCPLTSNGIKQSMALNDSSFSKHYSLIISSPLRRCLDTLKLSKLTFDDFEINDLFREIRSGCKSDLLNENEAIIIESEQEIKERITKINECLLKKKDLNLSNILIVTHADLIWNLTAYEVNGELFGKWLKNAELFHWKCI